MSAVPVTDQPRPDWNQGLFVACILGAVLLHAGAVWLLRDRQFFGMAAFQEEARQLFRVPVREIAPPRPRPRPMQVPEREAVLAAVEEAVAKSLETLAELPPVSLAEPPPATQLEEFARARPTEVAPPRAQAPTHLDVLEEATALIGSGVIRDEVQVVARRAEAGGGGRISAATARAVQQAGPVGQTSVAGRAAIPPGLRPAAPRPTLPARSERAALPRRPWKRRGSRRTRVGSWIRSTTGRWTRGRRFSIFI